MALKKMIPACVFGAFLFSSALLCPLSAEEISAAQEQEYTDARQAVQAAQKANAETYAPEPMKRAYDLLGDAEAARSSKDGVKFAQVSRLSRAHAELARALSELKGEEEKLAAANEELQKAKSELRRLKRSQ